MEKEKILFLYYILLILFTVLHFILFIFFDLNKSPSVYLLRIFLRIFTPKNSFLRLRFGKRKLLVSENVNYPSIFVLISKRPHPYTYAILRVR